MAASRTPYRAAMFWLKLILAVWAGTLILHQTDLGGRWLRIDSSTWTLLGLWVVIYAASYWAALIWNVDRQPAKAALPDAQWFRRYAIVFSGIAAAGALMITYDFAIGREYGFTTGAAAIRAMETDGAMHGEGGGSFISGIGRLLIPALQVAWLLGAIGWRKLDVRAKAALIVATLLVFAEQTLFEGGRFYLAALIAGSLIARFAVDQEAMRPVAAPKRKVPWVRLVVLGIVALLIFSYVFIDRVQERQGFYSTAYLGFADNFNLDVDSRTADRFDGFFGPMWFALGMFWMYVTHGVSELDVLLETAGLAHAHGLYQFPHVGQAILVLTGIDIRYDVFLNLPNPGTYNTIYGANYVDFGNGGALLSAAVLGSSTAVGARRLANGRLRFLGLCAPILLTIGLFAPMVSLVPNLWPALIWAALLGLSLPRVAKLQRRPQPVRRRTA